jgi:acyl CoA:acetate/3-ketoacid CoA transferase alpha subunit
MADKRARIDRFSAELRDGMTVGIGGWATRRKPDALVEAVCASPVRDLTVVSFGGPDVGRLVEARKVRTLVFGFVTLDAEPLEPRFRAARERGELEAVEYDEGMLVLALRAAAWRLPFLPTRAGLGSDVPAWNPQLRTVRSPYADGEELLAVPALPLDLALVHVHRADAQGNALILGDPYFDDLFLAAAARRVISCDALASTEELLAASGPHTFVPRLHVDLVVAP